MKIEKKLLNLPVGMAIKFILVMETPYLAILGFLGMAGGHSFLESIVDKAGTSFFYSAVVGLLSALGARKAELRITEFDARETLEADFDKALTKLEKYTFPTGQIRYRYKSKFRRFWEEFLGQFYLIEFSERGCLVKGSSSSLHYLIQQFKYQKLYHSIPLSQKI